MRISRLLSRLRADERGTSVIELALVAPVLAILTMGIIDIANGFSRKLQLTEAVNRTIERVAARDFQIEGGNETPDYTAIRNDAAAGAQVTSDKVTVVRWLECDGVEQESFEGECPADPDRPGCDVAEPAAECFPVMARYIEVRIDDSFRPFFSAPFAAGVDGTYPVFAEAAVRIQ